MVQYLGSLTSVQEKINKEEKQSKFHFSSRLQGSYGGGCSVRRIRWPGNTFLISPAHFTTNLIYEKTFGAEEKINASYVKYKVLLDPKGV